MVVVGGDVAQGEGRGRGRERGGGGAGREGRREGRGIMYT